MVAPPARERYTTRIWWVDASLDRDYATGEEVRPIDEFLHDL
jgi:hypothetical protein